MKKTNERTRWGICIAAVGALALTGAATVAWLPSAGAQDVSDRQFNRVCGRCHPHGEEDTGPAILNKNLDEAKMVKVIREGTKRMKAIPATKLSDAQLTEVMAYLRSIHAVH